MIEMPRRSVTRFFIPLIDVLILLFAIFLLMPLVEGSPEDGAEGAETPEEEVERLREELEQLRKSRTETPEDVRKELEELRKLKKELLQERLAVRVLEIEGTSGRLYYHDPQRAEVRTEADARALAARDRRGQATTRRELYYLILYPRDRNSPYPTREQRERYDLWFRDVAHGWDIPGVIPGREGLP